MKPKTIMWSVIGAIVAVVAVVALFGSPGGGGGTVNVDAAGAREAIEGGAQVIDVRTEGEYQMGHLPGAINVPVDQVATAAEGWDPNKTYVIYCATGSRSASAVQTLEAMGFGSIKHLNAGIQAWDGELEKGVTTSQKIKTDGKPVFIDFWTPS